MNQVVEYCNTVLVNVQAWWNDYPAEGKALLSMSVCLTLFMLLNLRKWFVIRRLRRNAQEHIKQIAGLRDRLYAYENRKAALALANTHAGMEPVEGVTVHDVAVALKDLYSATVDAITEASARADEANAKHVQQLASVCDGTAKRLTETQSGYASALYKLAENHSEAMKEMSSEVVAMARAIADSIPETVQHAHSVVKEAVAACRSAAERAIGADEEEE